MVHTNANGNTVIYVWTIKMSLLFCLFFGLHKQLSGGFPMISIADFLQNRMQGSGAHSQQRKCEQIELFHKQVKCTSSKIRVCVIHTEPFFAGNLLTNEYQPWWETWQPSNKWLHYQCLIFRKHALLWRRCTIGMLFTPFSSLLNLVI